MKTLLCRLADGVALAAAHRAESVCKDAAWLSRRSLARQMQALVNGVERQLQAVGNAELVENVVQMILHRLFADEHFLGHFLVLISLRDQRNDLALARGKRTALAALA